MIKELIGAIGMTLIYTPSANTPSTITQNFNIINVITPTTKGNIYTKYQYYGGNQNNEISAITEYATIDYTEIHKGNLGIKTRGKIITNRNIAEEEYSITLDLIIEITDNLNITHNDIFTNVIPPEYSKVNLNNQYTTFQYGYYSQLTVNQRLFIQGYSANTDWISTLNMATNRTILDTQSYGTLPDDMDADITDHQYYALRLSFIYDETQITNNGTSLQNNQNTLSRIDLTTYYTAEIEPTNYEVIDLPGLMFEILGMPFAWYSIAFNFTLFPGTPYAINISHILMGLLVSLIAIIIFKLIMRGR